MLAEPEIIIRYFYLFAVAYISIATYREVFIFERLLENDPKIGRAKFLAALLLPKRVEPVASRISDFQRSKIHKISEFFHFGKSGYFNRRSYSICLSAALIYPTFFLVFFYTLYGSAETDLIYVGFDSNQSGLIRMVAGVLALCGLIVSGFANLRSSYLNHPNAARTEKEGKHPAPESRASFWALNMLALLLGGSAGLLALDLYHDQTGAGAFLAGAGAILIITVVLWSPRVAVLFTLLLAIANTGAIEIFNYEFSLLIAGTLGLMIVVFAYLDRSNSKDRYIGLSVTLAVLLPLGLMSIHSVLRNAPDTWNTWGIIFAFVAFPLINSFFDWASVNLNFMLAERELGKRPVDEIISVLASLLLPILLSAMLVATLTAYVLIAARLLIDSGDSAFNFQSAVDETAKTGFYWIYAGIATNFAPALYRIYLFSVERVLVVSFLRHKSITIAALFFASFLVPFFLLEIDSLMRYLHAFLSDVFLWVTYTFWPLLAPS